VLVVQQALLLLYLFTSALLLLWRALLLLDFSFTRLLLLYFSYGVLDFSFVESVSVSAAEEALVSEALSC
jgi:hypothetical protein